MGTAHSKLKLEETPAANAIGHALLSEVYFGERFSMLLKKFSNKIF